MGKAAFAGAIGVVVLIIITALTFNAVNGLPFRPTTLVRAEFDDLHSLEVNDDIRENSLRIGRVSAVSVIGNKAVVTMELDGHPQVYRDARAEIWDVSALAAKFVELEPGTAAAGPIGDEVIPTSRTVSSVDLYQLLNVFDPTTRVAFAGFMQQFGGGTAGHSDDLHDFLGVSPDVLHNVGTISGDIASPQFDLASLISSSDRLVTHFQGREQQISELVRQTNTTFQALVTNNGAGLHNTLAKAPGTLAALRPALDSLNAPLGDTQVAMTTLRPGGGALGSATPNLRGFLVDSIPVSHQVPDFDDSAKPAVSDLIDTMHDARPLAPMATDAFDYLHTPLGVLAPYGPEIGQWLTRMHSFVGQGAQDGTRYAHLAVAPGNNVFTGGIVRNNGGVAPVLYDAYPKPGQAAREREGLSQGMPSVIGHMGGKHK
jgi:phospholipid/cholesterol/gamma-HCH transport system substrate-binding protein